MLAAIQPFAVYALVAVSPSPGEPQTTTTSRPAAGAAEAPAGVGPEAPPASPTGPASDAATAEDVAAPRRGPGLGMTISGFSMFGISYFGSALIGAAAYDLGDDAASRRYGLRMLIPIGGPFAAAPHAQALSVSILTGAAGVVQVAGLGVGIAGSVLLGRERAHRSRIAFGATPTRGGAHFAASLRF